MVLVAESEYASGAPGDERRRWMRRINAWYEGRRLQCDVWRGRNEEEETHKENMSEGKKGTIQEKRKWKKVGYRGIVGREEEGMGDGEMLTGTLERSGEGGRMESRGEDGMQLKDKVGKTRSAGKKDKRMKNDVSGKVCTGGVD
ncbi:hypothetical protein Pmani_039222 [Petrolisthes manimaculis]|uniref:PH domain-containing protein n=1 Tax=Petrolisthes manimaculis TaxID=1843537 RepID=A0AAE1NE67_9EUCA|nr:hypothetical protein Pmani_039222 [Petrolisthes manimaculis]